METSVRGFYKTESFFYVPEAHADAVMVKMQAKHKNGN